MSFSISKFWPGYRRSSRASTEGFNAPTPPPQEPSCFARGIARSIEEGGEKEWRRGLLSFSYRPYDDDMYISHRKMEMGLSIRWRRGVRGEDEIFSSPYPGCSWIRRVICENPTFSASTVDLHHIARALERRPLYSFAEMLKALGEADTLAKATREYFTKLGCPEDSNTSSRP